MNRHLYYENLKALARKKRKEYSVETEAFGFREVRSIYKNEGIKIDQWDRLPKKIKALYMCSDGDYSVAIQPKLPYEPKLFALIHELKHHYRDKELLTSGLNSCGDYNANEKIEIGAEVFAAEFIFPECEFSSFIARFGIISWNPEDVVHVKRECKARISYKFFCKRLERLGKINFGQFNGTRFVKLEEQLYGISNFRRRSTRRK